MRPTEFCRRALIPLALAAACYPGWLAVRPAAAQEQENPGPKPAAGKLTPIYVGVGGCKNAGCHGGGAPAESWKEAGFTLICRCDEYTRWIEHDKHADAYKVLLGERGRRMEKVLGYEVTKDRRCMSCHAAAIEDAALAKRSRAAGYKPEEGVNCAVCHGPYREWVRMHGSQIDLADWRALTRKQKQEQYGMTDLWDPVTRTKLCASCHVGNAKEGKEVTHDMYAAGHPPLPGFEAAMFCDEMPRHWQTLREKDSKELWKEQGYDGKTREQTQLLLVGSAVGLGESLRLIAAQASKGEGDPELAMFDCYSCHHDIRSPSWRQARPPLGKVGRVPMRTWPIDLVRLAVRHLAKDDAGAEGELAKLDAHVAALQKAFTAKQLGDAPRIVEEATAFAGWADQLAAELLKTPVDEAATKRLLALLPATFARAALDFDSARQVAWGYEVLSRDLGAGKGKPPAALAELEKYLDLRLPRGRTKDGKSAIEAESGERMRRLYDYEPAHFRKLLGKLAAPE